MIRVVVQKTDGRICQSTAKDWDAMFDEIDWTDCESVQATVESEVDWDDG